MGVDEARNDDVAFGVDDVGALGRQVRPDRRDAVVLDEDVGVREFAELVVLGEDDASLDQRAVAHVSPPSGLI